MRLSLASAALATCLLGSSLFVSACGDDESDVDRYYARCAVPRTEDRFDDTQGTLDDEKKFLRAWIHDLYLWYREVPEVDPAAFETAIDYFDELRTREITASGKAKDQFHFIYPSDVWEQLSQSGVEGGYGATWAVIASKPPRKIVAAYAEPGSAATTAGIRRGTEVLSVDGVDVVNGSDIDTLNAGLFPEALGASHTFVVKDYGAADSRTVTMVSASIRSIPVQNVKTIDTPTGKVGYLTFNDHIGTAEIGLINAITQLQTEQVTDLVLDLRYNGGGYLAIAAELSYMIAGPEATKGKAFERLTFNDHYKNTDPFSGEKLTPSPFPSTAIGFSATTGRPLPSLSLPRVFVLTGSGTCSASESIINGLRGIDVEVIQIGATTCGKPYGFVPQDNCGTTYFAIQFQGVNQQGFGDYADGFTPGGSGGAGVPGCVIADDYSHQLGEADEGRLSAALAFRATGVCPIVTTRAVRGADDLSAVEGKIFKPAWRTNRILGGGPPRH